MVLSTADRSGAPAGAPLFFLASESLTLFWLSAPDSRHSRNLEEQPEAAVSVFAPVHDWREIRGVQMTGYARRAADTSILPAYRARFKLGPEFDAAIASSAVWEFRPRWLRFLDNSLGFGFKIELEL